VRKCAQGGRRITAAHVRQINTQHATQKRIHSPPYSYGLAARAGSIYNAIACSGGRAFVNHHGRYHWRPRGPDS